MEKSDLEREVILRHWAEKTKAGDLPVYDHGCEGIGLPTLGTMSLLAKALGAEVVHCGFGVFKAQGLARSEMFTFCGGGAMMTVVDAVGDRVASWCQFDGKPEAWEMLASMVPGVRQVIDTRRSMGLLS